MAKKSDTNFSTTEKGTKKKRFSRSCKKGKNRPKEENGYTHLLSTHEEKGTIGLGTRHGLRKNFTGRGGGEAPPEKSYVTNKIVFGHSIYC